MKPGVESAVIAIALTAWPPYARLARAETLTVRRTDYVAAARMTGATVIDEDLQIPEHPWASRPWNGIQDSVVNLQRHWVECLRTGRTPETSGADTLRTMELTLGAYESLETGLPYRVGSAG